MDELKQHALDLVGYVKTYFSDKRRDKILELLREYYSRILTSPASSKKYYHCCFDGGWLIHTLNVIDNGLKLAKLWVAEGIKKDWTDSELVFACMFHDFGKLGDENGKMYINEKNSWKRNHGTMYSFNPNLEYMKVQARSIYILQSKGIKITMNEYFGIMLADGLFDTDNKTYYHAFETGQTMTTNLPIIVHHADQMSSRIEFQMFND